MALETRGALFGTRGALFGTRGALFGTIGALFGTMANVHVLENYAGWSACASYRQIRKSLYNKDLPTERVGGKIKNQVKRRNI